MTFLGHTFCLFYWIMKWIPSDWKKKDKNFVRKRKFINHNLSRGNKFEFSLSEDGDTFWWKTVILVSLGLYVGLMFPDKSSSLADFIKQPKILSKSNFYFSTVKIDRNLNIFPFCLPTGLHSVPLMISFQISSDILWKICLIWWLKIVITCFWSIRVLSHYIVEFESSGRLLIHAVSREIL